MFARAPSRAIERSLATKEERDWERTAGRRERRKSSILKGMFDNCEYGVKLS